MANIKLRIALVFISKDWTGCPSDPCTLSTMHYIYYHAHSYVFWDRNAVYTKEDDYVVLNRYRIVVNHAFLGD
jgi:hypothetical protein